MSAQSILESLTMTLACSTNVTNAIIDYCVDNRIKVESLLCHLDDIRSAITQFRHADLESDVVYRFTGPDSLPIVSIKGNRTSKRFQIVVTQFAHNGRFELVCYAG
jgi:hypothetical protein